MELKNLSIYLHITMYPCKEKLEKNRSKYLLFIYHLFFFEKTKNFIVNTNRTDKTARQIHNAAQFDLFEMLDN